MLRSRFVVLAVIVMGLIVGGCTPQELAEIFDVRDLSASEDPVEVAAGEAAEALDSNRAAQRLADEGLREKSEDKLKQAAQERPRDARYPAYLAAHALAEGNTESYETWLRAAAGIVDSERDETIENLSLEEDSEEERRISFEADIHLFRSVIEGLDWALAIENGRTPVETDRVDRLEAELCKLHARYLDRYRLALGGPPILVLVGGADCEAKP